MTDPALSISRLAKAYGDRVVLAGLDLEVATGGLTAVLGPSGSGKTTLLRLIAGFEHPDAGTIAIHDLTVATASTHLPPEDRRIGYVPQEGALFPHLSVAKNVVFGLPRGRRSRHRAEELLELVGLADLADRPPHELSGGEQQRVALARALAPGPRLVLLDEPFSALDPTLRTVLRNDVRTVLRATETTALLVTHDQQEALSLADEVGVLRGGRIVQTADPETLYRNPVDPEVAAFVGDAVFLPARLADGYVDCALGRLPARARPAFSGPATAMIRPEQLRLGAGPARARVLETTYYGHDADTHLVLTTPDGADHHLIARTVGHTTHTTGEYVHVAVEGEVVAYPAGPVSAPPRERRNGRSPAADADRLRPGEDPRGGGSLPGRLSHEVPAIRRIPPP